ncbi:DUF3068 domain-containing protein [Streptosporangium sp. NPDC050855]|uniref:DUF3068 domain-containing protein n=1 Tax=Streptosporangium sp. NPDC050855 TaxID=3366194 RepID=UPI0037A8344B
MRRVIGLVLIGLGAFLLVLAPLVRFQVAPALIAAPADQYGISKLEATDAQYFSVGDKGKVVTGDLDITVTTRGDVAGAQGDRVVWDEVMVVNDVTNSNPLITYSERRSAFNKYTGEGINCCSVKINDEPAQLQGQIYKWPFDVEKKTYSVFNSTTGKAFDARFVTEEQVGGLRVYRFEQTIPPTTIDTLSAPASYLGMDETGDVEVDRVYDGVNTFWIEPTTGSPVRQEQQRHDVLKTQDGVERSVAFVATAKMTQQTQDELVKNATDGKNTITMLRTTIPLVLLVLGLALVITGLLLIRRRAER